MAKSNKKRKPYDKQSDIEKIRSNWKKIRGLLEREEWSSAIVRAATATEIAANLVVREELIDNSGLESDFADHLLKWSNGIQGKFDKLIIPITKGKSYNQDFKRLEKRAADINLERNSIVHSGQFKNRSTAIRVVTEAREIILALEILVVAFTFRNWDY